MIIDKTVTSIFMVPTLGIDRVHLKTNNFLNAYYNDINKDIDYSNVIFLLFKPKNLENFKEFLDKEYEKKESNIIEDYDYNKGYVVVIYKLNEKYKKDFDLIRESKYSKTSKEFQSMFNETVDVKNKKQKSIQYLVFNKKKALRDFWENTIGTEFISEYDQEVWPDFNTTKEILNINVILENEDK